MVITSFYGMKYELDKRIQRNYAEQRQKCKAILGNKYLLANHVQRKGDNNEKVFTVTTTHPRYITR